MTQGSAAAQRLARSTSDPAATEAPSEAFPKYPPHLVHAMEGRLRRLESRLADVERTLVSMPQVPSYLCAR